MTRDLVHALAEFDERIGQEAGANATVGGSESLPAILAQVVAAGRDAQVHPIPVAQDGVQAETAVARLPLASVIVVADARNHLPGITAVAASEQRGRLDAAPEVLPAGARFERPDVGQRAPVFLREGGSRLRLLERLPEISRAQHLHAKVGIAARSVNSRRATRVDQRGVNGHARAERPAQREAAASLGRLRDEESLLGADAENNAVCHIQPPEMAGRIVTASPGMRGVSSPLRSRM